MDKKCHHLNLDEEPHIKIKYEDDQIIQRNTDVIRDTIESKVKVAWAAAQVPTQV